MRVKVTVNIIHIVFLPKLWNHSTHNELFTVMLSYVSEYVTQNYHKYTFIWNFSYAFKNKSYMCGQYYSMPNVQLNRIVLYTPILCFSNSVVFSWFILKGVHCLENEMCKNHVESEISFCWWYAWCSLSYLLSITYLFLQNQALCLQGLEYLQQHICQRTPIFVHRRGFCIIIMHLPVFCKFIFGL